MSWLITGSQKINWDPSLISTALWLDAADASTITQSGGAVSQWSDKSGNSRNATAATTARPTLTENLYNGKSALVFNGTSNTLTGQTVPVTNYSWFTVCTESSQVSSYIALQRSGPTGATEQQSLISKFVTPGNFEFFHTGSARTVISGTATGLNIAYVQRISASVVTRFNAGSETSPIITNSQQIITALTLGSNGAGAAWFNGNIAEIIITSGVLAADIRQKLEGYLAHKWGLTANLPADHPFKVNPPAP
jgi:hypothetical protein